jgi:hypothetical protein
MSKLQAALAWAARGFPVFPLAPNEKIPLHDDWPSVATTDPDVIRSMWTDPVLRVERDYNIGTKCNDIVVVDVDVKDGKDGHNEYMQLGGTYETLVVQTTSGGFHCYFEGPDSANISISSAVDIRSHNGFAVAPGSTIDGKEYRVIKDVQPAWVPYGVEKRLQPPYTRTAGGSTEAIDSPASVAAGIRFLESAPPAIEGQRGDETTFVTAARLVRELALSVETAFDLMAQYYNPRCVPPWSLDELRGKVENAHAYGTADHGRLDPSVTFASVSVQPPPTIFSQVAAVFGNASDPATLPPRPWMMDRLLMLHENTLLLAPGSVGKSSLVLAVAAHLAVGADFFDFKTHVKCKSVIYNGEDDVDEQTRRLLALCIQYRLDFNVVRQNVMLLSSDQLDLRIAAAQGTIPYRNDAMYQQLIGVLSDPDVGMFGADPLIDMHNCDEGNNVHMNFVMQTFKHIAREGNVCNLIAHHTSKGGGQRQEERVGNMDTARGASGIVYKSRIAYTLMNATQVDCEEYGMQDGDRGLYVRFDDAKMNLALASNKPKWFKRETIKLMNGDAVGVLHPVTMQKNAGQIRMRLADIIMDTMTANGTAVMTISQAVAVIKANEPLYANKTDVDIKKRLEGLFATAVEVKGRTLHARREGEGAKATLAIVME